MAPQEVEQYGCLPPPALKASLLTAAADEPLPAAAAREAPPSKKVEAKVPPAEAKEEAKERKASIFNVFGRVSSMLTGGGSGGGGAKKVRVKGIGDFIPESKQIQNPFERGREMETEPF